MSASSAADPDGSVTAGAQAVTESRSMVIASTRPLRSRIGPRSTSGRRTTGSPYGWPSTIMNVA